MNTAIRYLKSRKEEILVTIAFILFITLYGLFGPIGCVTLNPIQKAEPQEVTVKVVTQDADTLAKEIKKESKDLDLYEKKLRIKAKVASEYDSTKKEPDLPMEAVQIGDKIFYSIWSYISDDSALDLRKTIEIMRHRGLHKLHIYINSGGGSAFAGLACADVLMDAKKHDNLDIQAEANGLVASAAVPIFVCVGAPNRTATRGTSFMVHKGKLFKLFAEETKDDLASQKKMMDQIDERYNKILLDNSNLTLDTIKTMVDRTTWFTAEEAKTFGLVDTIK